MKKKIAKTLLLCSLVGIVGVGGTYSYFTGHDEVDNSVTVGHLTTEVREDYPDNQKITIDKTSNPSVKKVVSVTNNVNGGKGSVPCWVRVELTYSNSDIASGLILQGLNTTDWIKDGDWYYYKKVLGTGETTSNLITGYSIDTNRVNSRYKDYIKDFSVNVYEESVPSEITELNTVGSGNSQAKTTERSFGSGKEAFTYFATARK